MRKTVQTSPGVSTGTNGGFKTTIVSRGGESESDSDTTFSKPMKNCSTPGTVIVQIDGLSREQFERAIINGSMPFISNLLASQHHSLHSFYSGLPSSTPAVQAELFYGVKCAVPSFGFFDRSSSQLCTMLQAHVVEKIEGILKRTVRCLLDGGSAYADIYSGGAIKSHYCVAGKGMEPLTYLKRVFNPGTVVTHLLIIPRLIALLFLEMMLSFVDFFRGVIVLENVIAEIAFIPARVGICVLLRELVVIGVCNDIGKGVARIHCNCLGYDEQAHRRGPSSRFAHWTLKGIDDAIRRIVMQIKKSNSVKYDIWIYSDHGQESTRIYSEVYGRSVRSAITQTTGLEVTRMVDKPVHDNGIQLKRIHYLGWKAGKTRNCTHSISGSNRCCSLSLVGPLGHMYFHFATTHEIKLEIALTLVKKAHIPSVLFIDNNDKVVFVSEEGIVYLDSCDKSCFAGKEHVFADEINSDMERLVRHPDAGELVLSGWSKNCAPISFPKEHGGHGGPGTQETHGFLIIPPGIRTNPAKNYYRPIDLRSLLFLKMDS